MNVTRTAASSAFCPSQGESAACALHFGTYQKRYKNGDQVGATHECPKYSTHTALFARLLDSETDPMGPGAG